MSRSSETRLRERTVCSTRQAGRCCLAETECGQSTPQNTHEYRHFKTFQKVLRTGIRLPGPCPLFFKTASPSLRRLRISVAQKATFFELFWLANTEKSKKGLGLTKSQETFLSRTQTSSVDLPVVHEFQKGKLRSQKHHDLAYELGVWHVMCKRPPKSCRRRLQTRNKNGVPYSLNGAPQHRSAHVPERTARMTKTAETSPMGNSEG